MINNMWSTFGTLRLIMTLLLKFAVTVIISEVFGNHINDMNVIFESCEYLNA